MEPMRNSPFVMGVPAQGFGPINEVKLRFFKLVVVIDECVPLHFALAEGAYSSL